MLQLYTHPLSTFGRRVQIALLEKGIDCETVVVDMPKGAHRAPEYRGLDPYGRVPTLVDGDFVLPDVTPKANVTRWTQDLLARETAKATVPAM